MQLELFSKDFEITEAIKSHAEKVTGKLDKLRATPTFNNMILKKDGSLFVSEYSVRTNIGDFFAKAEDHDCYKSISAVVTKLFEQIKRKIDKLDTVEKEKLEAAKAAQEGK